MIFKFDQFVNEDSNPNDPWKKYGYKNKSRAEKLEMTKEEALDKYAPWYDWENCETKMYRMVDADSAVRFIDPKKHKRGPRHSPVLYQLFIDEWKGWPNRSESVICSTKDYGLSVYGKNLYRVIPIKENSLVAFTPSSDIWSSFGVGLWTVDNKLNVRSLDIDSLTKKLVDYYYAGDAPKDLSLDDFKKRCQEIDIEKNPIVKSKFDQAGHKWFDTKEDLLRFKRNYPNGFYDVLDEIIDPMGSKYIGEFQLLEYNNETTIDRDSRTECWTDQPCLMIKVG